MVQPKKPPLSVRFPDDLLAEVDAYAARHEIARNAALIALVRRGLTPQPEVKAAPVKKLPDGGGYEAPSGPMPKPPSGGSGLQLGPTPRKPGWGLKPEKGKR